MGKNVREQMLNVQLGKKRAKESLALEETFIDLGNDQRVLIGARGC